MEADWEVEIGGSAAVIDVNWAGYVDLRLSPERATDIPEALDLPALAEALPRLNGQNSGIRTSKCDVWHAGPADPYELDATPGEAGMSISCYIDLVPCGDSQRWTPQAAVGWCKQVCSVLHAVPARCCRGDLIVRRAIYSSYSSTKTSPAESCGVTLYLTGCGTDAGQAQLQLARALSIVVEAIVPRHSPANADPKLQ